MRTRGKNKNERNSGGTALIELACVAVMLAVVTVLSVDIGIMLLAFNVNDRACRDAARAAGGGTDYASALRLAQSSVCMHKTSGSFIGQPTVDTAQFGYYDSGLPTNCSPYVSCTTNISVRLPATIYYAGAKLDASGAMTFSRKYTYPIIKLTLVLPP